LKFEQVQFHLLDEVVVALKDAPPQLFSDRLQGWAVETDMPALAPGDPHTTLYLVHDVAGVILKPEGPQPVGCDEAFVLGPLVVSDQAVRAGSESTVFSHDEAGCLDNQTGLKFVMHAGVRLELLAAAHGPGLKAFIQRFAADAFHSKTKRVVLCRFRELTHGLAGQCFLDRLSS